jgi:uncharacterized membrane protein
MAVVAGTFLTQSEAEDAIRRLEAAGLGEDRFSLVSHADDAVGAPEDDEQRAHHVVDVATVGAAAGAVLIGALFGPVGAVIGGLAAGGGIAAALESRGMVRADAEAYERRLHEGRFLLAVELDPDDPRTAEVEQILRGAGAGRIGLRE